MAIDAHTAAQIYTRLANLQSVLERERDLHSSLTDGRLTIACFQTGRKEYVTCARRPDDAGRLWYFDHDRRPVIEADNLTDAAVLLGGRVRAGLDV